MKDELGPRSKFKNFAKGVFGSSKRPPSRDTPLTDSTNQAMDTDAPNGTAEPKPKTRKIKKQVRKGELPLSSGTSSLDQQTKDAAAEKEGAMFMEDKLVADTEDKKNELESYIYELRSKIDDQYSEFAGDEEKSKLKEKLEQSEVRPSPCPLAPAATPKLIFPTTGLALRRRRRREPRRLRCQNGRNPLRRRSDRRPLPG